MYTIKKKLSTTIFCILIGLIVTLSCKAQGSINVTGGFGIMEVMYAGINFQENQTQIGIKLGTMPNHDIFTVTLDASVHLLGHSELSDLKPFYLKAGYTYFVVKYSGSFGSLTTHKNNILFLKPGREINITRRFGINLDAGLLVIVSSSNSDKYLGSINEEKKKWKNIAVRKFGAIL